MRHSQKSALLEKRINHVKNELDILNKTMEKTKKNAADENIFFHTFYNFVLGYGIARTDYLRFMTSHPHLQHLIATGFLYICSKTWEHFSSDQYEQKLENKIKHKKLQLLKLLAIQEQLKKNLIIPTSPNENKTPMTFSHPGPAYWDFFPQTHSSSRSCSPMTRHSEKMTDDRKIRKII